MASLNRVMIIGNVGKDPEIIKTQSGTSVARFSVATTETWTDKATREKKEKTEWHRIVAYAKLGETCGLYLTKGKQVYVEGKLQTTSYEKDGITRYTTDIIANAIQFLGARGEGGATGQGGGGYQHNSGYQGGGGSYSQPNRNFKNNGPQNQNNLNQGPTPDFDHYMGDPGFQPPPDADIPF